MSKVEYAAKPFPAHVFNPNGFIQSPLRIKFDGTDKDRSLFVETHPTYVALALESGLPRKFLKRKYSSIESYNITDPEDDAYDLRESDPVHTRALDSINAEYNELMYKHFQEINANLEKT